MRTSVIGSESGQGKAGTYVLQTALSTGGFASRVQHDLHCSNLHMGRLPQMSSPHHCQRRYWSVPKSYDLPRQEDYVSVCALG